MKAGLATMLNVGPVMPGAAACVCVRKAPATLAMVAIQAPVLMLFTANLLDRARFGGGIDRRADVDFGHLAAEVLGVVRQVVQVGGVHVEHLSGGVRVLVARVHVYFGGSAATESD